MKRIIFIVVSIILLISCNDVLHDEEFTLIRKPFEGNQIRTNGYYYTYENKEGLVGAEITSVLLFYKNGVAANFGYSDSLEKMEAEFRVSEFYMKDNPFVWGVFRIEGDSIKIERSKSFGTPKAYMYTLVGVVQNDSTILITKDISSTGNGGKTIIMNQTYHFKQFSPKPDSTNVFINLVSPARRTGCVLIR
ncbi:MAG: hypothetical protein VB126_05355 [Paludibacter sp.]|nr:hypothetical protein [Paludibacter sp.]